MKTTAVRLYGARDLRVETFDLPEPGDGEILMRVVADSLCASTYKAVIQGTAAGYCGASRYHRTRDVRRYRGGRQQADG